MLPEQEKGHCDCGTGHNRKREGARAGKGRGIEGLRAAEKINNTIRDTGGHCTESDV